MLRTALVPRAVRFERRDGIGGSGQQGDDDRGGYNHRKQHAERAWDSPGFVCVRHDCCLLVVTTSALQQALLLGAE
eukprot:scaffold49576_cov37-Phaeocystis_antarctica.AAC.1